MKMTAKKRSSTDGPPNGEEETSFGMAPSLVLPAAIQIAVPCTKAENKAPSQKAPAVGLQGTCGETPGLITCTSIYQKYVEGVFKSEDAY